MSIVEENILSKKGYKILRQSIVGSPVGNPEPPSQPSPKIYLASRGLFIR